MSQGEEHIYSDFSEEPPRDENGVVEVDLSEADAPPPEGQQETRQDRRNLRAVEHQLGERDQRISNLETQLQQANERFNSFAATMMQGQRREPERPQRDPYSVRLEDLVNQEESHLNSWQNAIRAAGEQGLSEEQQRKFRADLRRIQDERQSLLGEQSARRVMQFTGQRQQGLNPQQAATLARLQAEFPDVMGNQQAINYAVSTWQREISAGGKDDWNTVKRAMEETMTRFNMAAPPVSDGTRRRHMGHGSGGGGQGRQSSDDHVAISPSAQQMAMAAFPELPPREAIKKWAKQRREMQSRRAG